MNTEVLDQNGDVYFMLENKSFFVHTKCLRFLNKSFEGKNKIYIAPANYTAEVVCIDQILPKSTWLNQGIDFLIIFSLPDLNETWYCTPQENGE